MNKIGVIDFNNQVLDIYGTVDRPCFIAADVAKIMEYSNGNTQEMLNLVEEDEKFLSMVKPLTKRGGNKKESWFVTELGLYNVLSQSRKPTARLWRRVVHQQLINIRKARGLKIEDQFDEWDSILDTIYIDEKTGVLMQSVTVAGGDVEQVP